ncbi:hypothetical protein D9M69_654060 [compost metagenome]
MARCTKRPFLLLYLLVDEQRRLPLAAALSVAPMGTALRAWLEAAAVGRPPPRTLRLPEPLPDADLPGLRHWIQARPVCLERPSLYRKRRIGSITETLMRSALRAVDLAPVADEVALAYQAAQQRLDLWYRSYGGR